MSDLSAIEKRKLEKVLGMSSGYVLNFSNRTFEEFFLDTLNISIFNSKYEYGSGSKANRMRAFWNHEPNFIVAKALEALVENWDEYADEPPSEDFMKILHRLKLAAPVPDIDIIRANADEASFEALAKAVRDSIEKNEPEAGLDRLHTYLVKYFRHLCQKHDIYVSKETPLHSLVGEYIKVIKAKGLIESDITERILKSTISIMEAFNKIRNDHSFAHDNKVLNYNESLLIFGHVTSSVRFIESIETLKAKQTNDSIEEELPF